MRLSPNSFATAIAAFAATASLFVADVVSSAPTTSTAARTIALPQAEVVVPGTVLVRRGPDLWERWEMDSGVALTAEATIDHVAALRAASIDAHVDVVRRAQIVPDDYDIRKQWPLVQMHAEAAWDVITGDPDLVVAVVDTGVILDHPDLKARLVAGYDFITDPENAGDGSGRDANPTDEGDESESSTGFHGTHIAGILGASTGNGFGMAGVDWRCRIQPVRALGVHRATGKDSDIADAIRWAAGINVPGVPQNQTPAKVINLSFGSSGYSQILQDAVLAAVARGAVIVASAGNSSREAIDNVPGALEGVISVAASGPDGLLASYSNFGDRVDVMAPGGSVSFEAPVIDSPQAVWSLSYVRSSKQPVLAYLAGTSQAAAHASGVAALVRAAAPSLRPEVVAAVLRRASVLPPGGCDPGCGAGILDASKAVADARAMAVATCGDLGCGNKKLEPAPLRPEEGCAVSSNAIGRDASSFTLFMLAGAIGLLRRRARSTSFLAFCALLGLAACSGGNGERTAQFVPGPPHVRVLTPIPTNNGGDLEIAVGDGASLTLEMTPIDQLDRLELRALDPEELVGRLGHAPLTFALTPTLLGKSGRRQLCADVYDASGASAETCFFLVK